MEARPAGEVFWATPRDPETLDALLTATDRAHLAWLRSARARSESATARALLRGAVAARHGIAPGEVQVIRICPSCDRHHGRPLVDGLHVSTSHSDGRVLVAITDVAPIGVDIEWLDAERFNGITFEDDVEQRIRLLDATDRTRSRAEEWTRREAYAKAHGIATPFDHALVTGAGTPIDVGSEYVAAAYLADDVSAPITIIAADDLLSAWAASPRTATA